MKWLEGQFVSGIYAGEWYNKQKVKEEYIGDKMSILLGMPRLRQLRVQKGRITNGTYMARYFRMHTFSFSNDTDKALVYLT